MRLFFLQALFETTLAFFNPHRSVKQLDFSMSPFFYVLLSSGEKPTSLSPKAGVISRTRQSNDLRLKENAEFSDDQHNCIFFVLKTI